MFHNFHIPVLGLAFSIDTPVKVAKYGLSSTVSIVDDQLIEHMRRFHAERTSRVYEPIASDAEDARARRITAYLDLLQDIVDEQISALQNADLKNDPEVAKYFRLLPDTTPGRQLYERWLKEGSSCQNDLIQDQIRACIVAGSIDVNIMSKVDKLNKDKLGNTLDAVYSDASAALRGFAHSKLHGALVLSAGMNPRLYQYLSELSPFFPDDEGRLVKRVVLKVSDYRSALIQAKYLAKKGVWISEFRVESGLNCGGHAFATDGYLLGPILEEFKSKRKALEQEISALYIDSLKAKDIIPPKAMSIRLTAQGGIGTAEEQQFLMEYYELDGTGWGSPFLLVPEATTVDPETLTALTKATSEDFYVSGASPLGVPFNNFRHSQAEALRRERIAKGRPGAPCTKKYLVSNTEYTKDPICTASRAYQSRKLKELRAQQLPDAQYQSLYNQIVEKTCLCEGLAVAAYQKYGIETPFKKNAVAICPGPNTAFFDRVYSLEEMVAHIYGRINLLKGVERPSMFINELHLYLQHFEKQISDYVDDLDTKRKKYLKGFVEQLSQGIDYYKELGSKIACFPSMGSSSFLDALSTARQRLDGLAQLVW